MSKIYYLIMSLLFGVFFLYVRTRMLTLDLSDAVEEGGMTTLYILCCVLLSILAIVLSLKNSIKCHLSIIFGTLMVIIYIVSIMYPLGSRNQYGEILMPLVLFTAMSKMELTNKSTAFVLWSFTIGVLLLVYTFHSEYISLNIDNIEGQNNASYYELYFLPFLLCHSKKIVRYIMIAIISMVVLISLKRGGFMALMLALVVYFYILETKITPNKTKISTVITLALVIIVITSTVLYVNTNLLGGLLFERMAAIEEGGGSGRTDIYEYYLSFINDSPIEAIIFGRGWQGSIRDSNIGYTCHNDFLESIIDFGIFGFILYVLLYIALIKQCVRMVKSKHEYAPAMGASIALFAMNSMVSHILIYPWYMTTFALFWGFIIASTRKCSISSFNIKQQ